MKGAPSVPSPRGVPRSSVAGAAVASGPAAAAAMSDDATPLVPFPLHQPHHHQQPQHLQRPQVVYAAPKATAPERPPVSAQQHTSVTVPPRMVPGLQRLVLAANRVGPVTMPRLRRFRDTLLSLACLAEFGDEHHTGSHVTVKGLGVAIEGFLPEVTSADVRGRVLLRWRQLGACFLCFVFVSLFCFLPGLCTHRLGKCT